MIPALTDIEAHITPERLNQGRQLFTDGPQSARLLEALLATGRCYLEQTEHQAPLGQGPARRIAFHWQMDARSAGQTRERQTPVQRFQDGEAPLFLISLKAGGVGLNLTAADVVIHYDPWWNPAVERQASDRAHRIGQQRAVFVYKLICEGTLEEKIHAMQQRKQALADGLYQGGGNHEPRWNEQDLEMLFQPLDA
jgi:ERCC4-related helicase